MMSVGTLERVSPGGKRLGFRYQLYRGCCHWPGPEQCPWVGSGDTLQGRVTGVSIARN